jgi:hypothetical protein
VIAGSGSSARVNGKPTRLPTDNMDKTVRNVLLFIVRFSYW